MLHQEMYKVGVVLRNGPRNQTGGRLFFGCQSMHDAAVYLVNDM